MDGWLVEPFVFVMAAFTVLLDGKLGRFGRGVRYWVVCMAAAMNG